MTTKPKRILIVEDDKAMRDAYSFFFNDRKDLFEITMAEDAVQGARVMNTKDFNLLILDVVMEPVAGDSLAVYLRQREEGREVPILVVSVLAQEALDDLRGMRNVFFMRKPIEEKDLFLKIEEILKP